MEYISSGEIKNQESNRTGKPDPRRKEVPSRLNFGNNRQNTRD